MTSISDVRKIKAYCLFKGIHIPPAVNYKLKSDSHDYSEAIVIILNIAVNGNFYNIVQEYDRVVLEHDDFLKAFSIVSRLKKITERPFNSYKRTGDIIKEVFSKAGVPIEYKMLREGDKLRKAWIIPTNKIREELLSIESKLAEITQP